MREITDRVFKAGVLQRFMDKYVKPGTGFRDENGRINLLWCNLKDPYYDQYVLIKTIDIPKIGLPQDLSMFVFFDGSGELFSTTFNELCQYINSLEEWDYYDAEVFDDTLEWLVVMTHDEQSMLIGFDEGA